jgi:glycosyltransferase involved in cell wall biosynthesis
VLARSRDAETVVRACGYSGPAAPIEYGVDEQTFYPRPIIDHSRPPGSLRLGYVGRIVVEKGLDDAIDAIQLTPPEITLSIMGEGPHEAALRRRIADLGLDDRVSFRAWGSPNDVADFIRAQDVMLLLTRTSGSVREQFGRTIIEAQSCGVPVIGSDCGAIPDVVGDGGWIVPEHNPTALADCLRFIVANPADLLRRATAGRRNVAARYTYEVIARKLLAAWLVAAGRVAAKSEPPSEPAISEPGPHLTDFRTHRS